MAVLTLTAVVALSTSTNDVCSMHDTGITDASEFAVVCYAGTFLVKMLGE